MARMTPFEMYSGYRFVLETPDGESIGCQRIWSDPFDPQSLWIVRGHAVDQNTLHQWMLRCENQSKRLKVRMLSHLGAAGDSSKDRVIDVSFDSWEWLPFDLDARDANIACEAMKLHGVCYHT